MTATTRVLVLGGTGSIGRLVVARLQELGDAVRVVSRDVERARRSLPAGTQVVPGDLSDVGSIAAALDGIDAVVLTQGAPYGSGEYEAVDYGAVPTLLDALDALDGRPVRVALMSSIGVTAAGGSSRELLDWKRRGERLLRASGLPYTIVRPGWFDAGPGTEQHVDLRQGDLTEYGPVHRQHVAETLAHAIHRPEAEGRTVEVFSTDGPPVTDWAVAFADTDPDRAGALDGVHDRPGPPLDDEPARVRHDLHRHRTDH
jgi:uncharacterized protein YbjT (DUF2867 family)